MKADAHDGSIRGGGVSGGRQMCYIREFVSSIIGRLSCSL